MEVSPRICKVVLWKSESGEQEDFEAVLEDQQEEHLRTVRQRSVIHTLLFEGKFWEKKPKGRVCTSSLSLGGQEDLGAVLEDQQQQGRCQDL